MSNYFHSAEPQPPISNVQARGSSDTFGKKKKKNLVKLYATWIRVIYINISQFYS